jgi:pyrroline-5-carboxylate reductase
MAGIPLSKIMTCGKLTEGTEYVRVMPNTPALIG